MCPSRDNKTIECDGQTTYGAKRIDALVEKETISFIREMSQKTLTEEFKDKLQNNINELVITKNQFNVDLIKIQKSILKGKEEILKAIEGESVFMPEEIRASIDIAQSKADTCFKQLTVLDDDIKVAKVALQNYKSLDTDIKNWVEEYNNGDILRKKGLMGQVIGKILLSKEGIEITYKLTVTKFLENSVEQGGEMSPLGRASGYNTPPRFCDLTFVRKVSFQLVDIDKKVG
jgi:hypothetical protein